MENNQSNTPPSINDEYRISNPTLIRIHREADNIQAYMNVQANILDAPSLPFRLNDMDAYLARVSDMQARTKAMKEYAKMTYTIENEEELSKMTATKANRAIANHLYEFTVTVDRMESLYNLLALSCRNLITQISFVKKQMEMH